MSDLSRRAILVAFSILGAVAPLGLPLSAETASPDLGRRLALRGYDPVSYFTQGRPEKGSPEFSAVFDDAVYWFTNAEHRAMFVADADRYAPQYGGFCAVGVSRGATAEPDPEAWLISDGRLYVFRSKEGQAIFRQQTAGIMEQAAANWPGLHKRP